MKPDNSEIVTVFVYLNTPPPDYVIENLRRVNSLFPEMQVIFASNIEVEMPSDVNVKVVAVDTSKLITLFQNHTLSSKFRNGFWQASLLRLLVLSEVHSLTPANPLLHIEADVLLMPDFPLSTLALENKLMWNGFNENTDVAALLYSPDISSTRHLVAQLAFNLESDPSLTDMKALANYRKKFSSKVELLPSQVKSANFHKFNCLFDGANFGMWLLGQDQRNHFGFLERFKDLEECDYRVGESKFTYGARKLALQHGDNLSVPLVNLHVHCKDPKIFKTSDFLLIKRVSQSNKLIKFPIFSLRIFLKLFFNALMDGEIKGFLLHLPLFGRIIKGIRRVLPSL